MVLNPLLPHERAVAEPVVLEGVDGMLEDLQALGMCYRALFTNRWWADRLVVAAHATAWPVAGR